MTYRGTIAYRANLHGNVSEGFLHSVVLAWDFLNRHIIESIQPPFYSQENNYHFMRGLSCVPAESANQIADTFLGEWVLMLDPDHIFAADSFYEMAKTFEENKLDVLVGFTQRRFPPYHPVIFKTDFDALKDFETIFPDPIARQTLVPIDSSGAACLMVRRKVFDQIKAMGERPFDPREKFHTNHIESFELVNDIQVPTGRFKNETFGEDSSFFWRAKMLGFKAFCAPWVKFHHLATVLVDEGMIQK